MSVDELVDISEAEPDYGGLTVTTLPDGTIEIDLSGQGRPEAAPQIDLENIAEGLDESVLMKIGQKIVEWVDADLESRRKWLERRNKGIERSGLTGEAEVSRMPGGSSVVHPLLIEAAVQFQARWIEEMFPPDGPCKATIAGPSDDELEDTKTRVEEHMNYQMLEEDEEFFEDMDDMGFALPFDGSTFKKSYFDSEAGYVTAKFIRAEFVVAPYSAKSVFRTPRLTHIMADITQNQMRKFVADGYYIDPKVLPTQTPMPVVEDKSDGKQPTSLMEDVPYKLYECHCEYNLKEDDEDAIALPYIITVESENHRVLAIRRNYRESDAKRRKLVWWNHYKYLPGLGFYGFGLYHAIGGLGDAATGVLRGILDGASAANWQGGFTSKDIRLPDGVIELEHGKWKQTENTADELKNAFYTPPFRDPSPAMFQVLGLLVESGHRFLSTTEAMVGEGAKNIPVGTTIARIEQGSKVYSAIHKRSHRVLTQEFQIRAFLNSIYLDQRGQRFQTGGKELSIYPDDYLNVKINPVSDPHIASTAQRVATAQAVLERSQMSPLYDRYEAEKMMLRALKVSNIDGLLHKPDQFVNTDAATEGQMLMMGRGVKAFPDQNHQAHIQVHAGQLQMAAQMPPPIQAAVMPLVISHLQEHYALDYREKMMALLQAPLPVLPDKPENQQEMPPEIEAQISVASAQATEQLMQQIQMNDPEAAQKQMEAEQHQADMAEKQARVQKMQQDMQVQAQQQQQPDIEARLKQAIAEVKLQAEAEVTQAEQHYRELEIQLKQKTAEAIASAKQASDDEISKHDSTAVKAQLDKEAKIEVAKIEQQAADKLFAERQKSDKQIEQLTTQIKELSDMIAEVETKAKEAEKSAEKAEKLAQDGEKKRIEESKKAAEQAAKDTEKQAEKSKREAEKREADLKKEIERREKIEKEEKDKAGEETEITFARGKDGKIESAKVKRKK